MVTGDDPPVAVASSEVGRGTLRALTAEPRSGPGGWTYAGPASTGWWRSGASEIDPVYETAVWTATGPDVVPLFGFAVAAGEGRP